MTLRLRIAFAGLTCLAAAWALYLARDAWPRLAPSLAEVGWLPLAAGGVLLALSALATFLPFATLARAGGIEGLSQLELGHLYFSGQLLKHVPGRIWGIGYHWRVGGAAGSLGRWIFVNLAHLSLAIYVALWTAATMISASRGWQFPLGLMVLGTVLYFAGWMMIASPLAARIAQRLPGRLGSRAKGVCEVLGATRARTRLGILLKLLLGSGFYYAAWACFGLAYPHADACSGMQLGALYMGAWFVGFASIFAPAGLGVRELMFAALAQGQPSDVIAFAAVLGRVALLLVDVLLGIAFLRWLPARSRASAP